MPYEHAGFAGNSTAAGSGGSVRGSGAGFEVASGPGARSGGGSAIATEEEADAEGVGGSARVARARGDSAIEIGAPQPAPNEIAIDRVDAARAKTERLKLTMLSHPRLRHIGPRRLRSRGEGSFAQR